jgi:hypothetical protein
VPSKTNTDRINELTVICATLSTRLEALLTEVRATADDHAKTSESLSAVKVQLSAVEVHVGGIGALKASLETISALETALALLKKDVEGLFQWKDKLKKERDESARRLWSFGPNIVGAVISGLIGFATALLAIWLNRSR